MQPVGDTPCDQGKHLHEQASCTPVQATAQLHAPVGRAGVARAGGCIRGVEGRVLPEKHLNRCTWSECPGCEPCPESHCRTCRRAHAPVTCASCLSLARTNLSGIRRLVGHLPFQATRGRLAYHHHHGIPGGDATVMLTPASPGWAPGRTVPVTVELPGDPRPPLDVLTYWTNVWREYTEKPTELGPTMDRACDYLAAQLHLVAEDPVFRELAKDLSRVLHQVENVLHDGERADVSRVPCWDCGTRLVKVWTRELRLDHWLCPTCGETYDRLRYEAAKHQQLASKGAERYVNLTDAVAVTGRPEQTVRSWARDGLVGARRGSSGRLEVWWPDVRDRDRDTPRRKRLA